MWPPGRLPSLLFRVWALRATESRMNGVGCEDAHRAGRHPALAKSSYSPTYSNAPKGSACKQEARVQRKVACAPRDGILPQPRCFHTQEGIQGRDTRGPRDQDKRRHFCISPHSNLFAKGARRCTCQYQIRGNGFKASASGTSDHDVADWSVGSKKGHTSHRVGIDYVQEFQLKLATERGRST